jgi:Lon protease-like protein
MRATESTGRQALALFPLQAVLFPGGALSLKIFEARYLDLITTCLREQTAFGVVALRSGLEVRLPDQAEVRFERVGTLAELISVDSDTPGILQVQCRGGSRFSVTSSEQNGAGLWVAQTEPIADDAVVAPGTAQLASVHGLQEAIVAMKAQGLEPFLAPHRFDDAGWVANRWCELLPISQAAKFRLMELADPLARLQLVDDYLRGKGVIGG